MSNEGETIRLDVVGEDSGTPYHDQGLLRVKSGMTFDDRFAVDRIRRELLGEVGGVPSRAVQIRAEMLAELNARIVQAPPWWAASAKYGIAGVLLQDDNVIEALFEKAMEKDRRLQRLRKEEAEKAQAQLKALQDEAAKTA